MPQNKPTIIKTSLAIALATLTFLGVLSVAGCGDKNSKSDFEPVSGKHPADWVSFTAAAFQSSGGHGGGHGQAAIEHIETCRPCRGDDFSGGISQVPCSRCHLGNVVGPGGVLGGGFNASGIGPDETSIHGPLGYALHATYVEQHGATACANAACHGVNLQGASGPSCSSCHMGGPFSVHPVEWADQIGLHGGFVHQNGTAACRNAVCHGPQLKGVFLSGPACNDCHNFPEPIPIIF